jgi:response regulator RpfG family c-di-GMP phosphodiesterase
MTRRVPKPILDGASAEAGVAASRPTSRGTVLFVEPDPELRTKLEHTGTEAGYLALTAASGEAAARVLTETEVDVVLSDVAMPSAADAEVVYLPTGWQNEGELEAVLAQAMKTCRLRRDRDRLFALTQAQNTELVALNASLEKKVEQRTAELTRTTELLAQAHREVEQGFNAAVQVFASLIQAGTRDTASVRKIGELARATAAALGLREEQQRNVHLAGLLCDLGKLALPEALIHTPVVQMSDAQAAEFKRHTVHAEKMLLPLKPLATVAAILRSHNERIDGQGYPDGLTGAAIPIESKVLHVVKDYDALQRRLILPEALTPAEAAQYLLDHVGSWYDGAVVSAFLRILKSMAAEDNPRELRVSVAGLKPGMTVTRDLVSAHGVLIVARGHRLDQRAIATLQRIADGVAEFVVYVQR